MEWDEIRSVQLDLFRDAILAPLQRYEGFVKRKIIEARAVLRCEGFEIIERAFLIKYRRITFQREGRVEDASAPAGGFLVADGKGRRICTKEEFRRTGRRGPSQGEPMRLSFDDRQAIEMGPDTAVEHSVTIDRHMVRRDGGSQIRAAGLHECNSVGGRDVFKNHLEGRKVGNQLCKCAFDEDGLPVKNIDIAVRDLAMQQQGHADPLHDLKH